MKATDYIARFLAEKGITHVYEVIGGMITHLVDSIDRQGQIQIVSMHHEQAAAFAAEGMGRITGLPGIALATSGPGATNLLTGIGSCYFDSTPAIFITGQVNRHERKKTETMRQLGFQETDIVSMARPITKAAWLVENAADLPQILQDAFELAISGRPGPVLIDIPMDVQREAVEPPALPVPVQHKADPPDSAMMEQLLRDLNQAKRPLIIAGGGIRSALCRDVFKDLAEILNTPVVCSLQGLDALGYEHPLRVGFFGSYGNRWSNLAIGESDFLLVLGSRLDIRQTGADVDSFKSGRVIYHVDCDQEEINNRLSGCYPIASHLRPFMDALIQRCERESYTAPAYVHWKQEIDDLKQQWPDSREIMDAEGINPNILMRQISEVSVQAAAYTVDVGQHQMWAAQSLRLQSHQQFLTSGGMGAMGFSLPAAIGAAMALPDQPVVVIAGDGAFQLNIQELQTVVRNRLPIKIIILNNQCHGMVRQFQQSYFNERYASTCWGYSAPDFARVALAYGIPAMTIREDSEIDEALRQLWQEPDSPMLLQVMIDQGVNVYPKIAFGRPMTDMEPFAKPVAMEST